MAARADSASVRLALARLELREGNRDAAREAVHAALGRAPGAELEEGLRADPDLGPLLGEG